jgi:hypothetical protein
MERARVTYAFGLQTQPGTPLVCDFDLDSQSFSGVSGFLFLSVIGGRQWASVIALAQRSEDRERVTEYAPQDVRL